MSRSEVSWRGRRPHRDVDLAGPVRRPGERAFGAEVRLQDRPTLWVAALGTTTTVLWVWFSPLRHDRER